MERYTLQKEDREFYYVKELGETIGSITKGIKNGAASFGSMSKLLPMRSTLLRKPKQNSWRGLPDTRMGSPRLQGQNV
jgi:hypothetical protein